MEITIINWEKFNPKRDQKSYSWLRLNNDIAIQSDLFGMTAIQKYIWIVLLCEASKQNKEQIEINIDYIAYISMTSKNDIMEAINELEKRNKIKCLSDNDTSLQRAVVNCSVTTPTNERTNERTNEESFTIDEASSDREGVVLSEKNENQKEIKPKKKKDNSEAKEKSDRIKAFYLRYPRKKDDGDKAALAKLRKLPLSEFDDLDKALDNYLFHLEISETDPRYYLGLYGFIDARNAWLCRSDLSRIEAALELYRKQAEC